jgi:anti-sigma factor RsiW
MHDPWTDRLSEYIDGELNAAEMELLERHLAGCDECRVTLQQLQDVVAAAHSLEDREPGSDVWAGIAAGLAAEPRQADAGTQVVPLRRAVARRFTMSAPQLAAAALLLMAFSAGAAWLISGAAGNGRGADYQQGTIFHAAHDAPDDVLLVGNQPAQTPAPNDLTATLDAASATLDPATVEVLERSIESINAAIADAHAALEADPGNPFLQRQLDSTLERRDAVIRRAGGVRRGGT